MIEAVVFDFNGVIVDDEPSHVVCFQQALAEFGLSLTTEDYYNRYLGMDERTCAGRLLTAKEGRCDPLLLRQIMDRKAELFRIHTAHHKPPLFPGVVEFVQQASARQRLAIASGGRREQILYALSGTAIEGAFEVIVAAEDCAVGKPDPAIYLLTLRRLNERIPQRMSLTPRDCVVIEDSKAGIQSARAAGMQVIGLATTYDAGDLTEADLVIPSLQHVTPETLWRSLAHTEPHSPRP